MTNMGYPTMNRCGTCGTYYSGWHNCPVYMHLPMWTNPPTVVPLGWRCPICGCGVSPWTASHCDKPARFHQRTATNHQRSSSRMDDEILRRLDAIEARQRAAGQHDPSCSFWVSWTSKRSVQARGAGWMTFYDDCDCWLAAELRLQTVQPGFGEDGNQ